MTTESCAKLCKAGVSGYSLNWPPNWNLADEYIGSIIQYIITYGTEPGDQEISNWVTPPPLPVRPFRLENAREVTQIHFLDENTPDKLACSGLLTPSFFSPAAGCYSNTPNFWFVAGCNTSFYLACGGL